MLNLKGIRDAVFESVDHAPDASPEAKERANEFINRAYYRMLQEAPYLFFEREFTFALEPAVEPASATDTISFNDAWTISKDLLPASGTSFQDSDGRVFTGRTILIKDSDGVWHRNQIREAWLGPLVWQATLLHPWKNATDANLDWRIQTDEFPLPHEITEVKSLILRRDQLDYPLEIIGQTPAEYASLTNDARLLVAGVPRWAFRSEHHQIPSPTRKPTTVTSQTNWDGAGTPAGSFQIRYTYVFGQTDQWFTRPSPYLPASVTQNEERRLPWWESGPSPESDQFTVTSSAADVTLPNLDAMFGFDDAGTVRYRRSGIRKRIYVKRISQTAGTPVESPSAYYLYDEVDSHVTTYTFDGSRVLDYFTRMPEIHGYQTIRVSPVPDARYEVFCRAAARPERLQDDSDVPRVHADAIEALIYKAQAYLREAEGSYQASAYANEQYERVMANLNKRYGDARPPGRSYERRVARVRPTHRLRRQFPIVS